ncbi:MAG TPA: serine acetyltransferase [Buttiauxella sp.]|uniref:serine acetyltransferase n=1 Tax=Buttiauxella sp. TaxID=1972222 RepID=UPI002B48335D|nr:serine acetyltransferase [Buttiauxella sp.]HKM96262.1 serine acetyltransferase [Buttiauxella sp.]
MALVMYLQLQKCLQKEVLKNDRPFSWLRTIHRALKCPDRRFYFWFRIWGYLYKRKKGSVSRFANKKLIKLNRFYAIDISPMATIGEGLDIRHFPGLVIRPDCVIGKNIVLRQNITIGQHTRGDKGKTVIGDNVNIGAGSCIIGDITIGSNVTIGAMSFINKNIPDNHIVYTRKEMALVLRES